jgi:branched-chain amino acid transport system ATP-binding protein
MLKVDKLNVAHSGLQVLWDVSINVGEHELVTIIGPNGAGKTTLVSTISGIHRQSSGSIYCYGKRLDGLEPSKICEIGVIHVPEGRKIFPLMKVSENLQLGAYLTEPRKHVRKSMDYVYHLFPVLKDRRGQLAGTLSGGEQQMLALGRGLMSQPKLLILDEPSLGLSPKLTSEIFATLKQLNAEGMTIVLISQEVLQSLKLAKRGYVLENGRIVLQGPTEHLLQTDAMRRTYLGL